jgi:hypothetical protein
MVEEHKLDGGNPCNYKIEDDDAEDCIGGWSGSALKDYWCKSYDFAKELADEFKKSPSDATKTWGTYSRKRWSTRSLAGFYRLCTYLLYMQVCALIVTGVVLFFVHFRNGGGGGGGAAAKEEEA